MIRTKRTLATKQITGINITPFTDVCLVLLIIFMVTATALTKESDFILNLPKGTGETTTLPSNVVVKIARDKRVMVNQKEIAFADLENTLRFLNREQNVKLLVIRADEGVPYGLVIQTIDTGRALGIPKFGLTAREPDQPPTGVTP